jgi:hypothetical protein
MKLLGIINVGLDITDQLLIRFSAFVRYWRKKLEYNETVHQLFRLQESVLFSEEGSIVQYSHSGVPMKPGRLIKMCLNKTYSKVCVVKHLSDSFPIQNGLKQGDALSPLLFNSALEYAIRGDQEN